MEKIPKLKKTKYLALTLSLRDKILNKIKIGDIKYKLFISTWIDKKKIFEERLNILFFNNKQDTKNSMKIFEDYFKKFINAKNLFKKLGEVLKEFYAITHKENIKKLEVLIQKIKDGNLNIIDKSEIKKGIDEFKNIFPDLDKKYQLKNSIFFVHLFRIKKVNNKINKEDDIFKEAKEKFKKLNSLFNENWITDIDESLFKEFYRVLKDSSGKKILKELIILKSYFELKDFNEIKLYKLAYEIIILGKKKEILEIVNSFIHFISELGVKQTEFSLFLKNLRDELLKINLRENINEYGELLKEYGINILWPNNAEKECINILITLNSKKDSIKFLMSFIKVENYHILTEFISENQLNFLTVIESMIKCLDFVHSLGEIKYLESDQDLIKSLIRICEKNNKNNLEHFIMYTNNFEQIREFFLEKLDSSHVTLNQIKKIIKLSNFTLAIINNDKQGQFLKFSGSFGDLDQKNDINYEYLIKLREMSILTKNLGDNGSKEEKEAFEFNKKFRERVNEIVKINSLLKEIVEKGYNEDIEIFIEIKDGESKFILYQSKKNKKQNLYDYESCKKYISIILSNITEHQINYYKKERTI